VAHASFKPELGLGKQRGDGLSNAGALPTGPSSQFQYLVNQKVITRASLRAPRMTLDAAQAHKQRLMSDGQRVVAGSQCCIRHVHREP